MQHICALCVTSKFDSMRCEAITAVSVRIVGFWDVMPPSLVLVSYSHVRALNMVTKSLFKPLQSHVASLYGRLFACDAICVPNFWFCIFLIMW